jgi:hypothetical protein
MPEIHSANVNIGATVAADCSRDFVASNRVVEHPFAAE